MEKTNKSLMASIVTATVFAVVIVSGSAQAWQKKVRTNLGENTSKKTDQNRGGKRGNGGGKRNPNDRNPVRRVVSNQIKLIDEAAVNCLANMSNDSSDAVEIYNEYMKTNVFAESNDQTIKAILLIIAKGLQEGENDFVKISNNLISIVLKIATNPEAFKGFFPHFSAMTRETKQELDKIKELAMSAAAYKKDGLVEETINEYFAKKYPRFFELLNKYYEADVKEMEDE